MPYASDSIAINNPRLDRRVKLTDVQKDQIKELHAKGTSIHEISRTFSISRRRIQFLLFPERLERALESRRAKGGSKFYYKKEKHALAMKLHRRYKNKLFKQNLIHKEA